MRPDSIGDAIDSGAVRERYEKLLGERDGEIADLRSKLAESERNLEAQRDMTTDNENAYYDMKSKADSLESANSGLRAKVDELSFQNAEKQARIDETQKGWLFPWEACSARLWTPWSRLRRFLSREAGTDGAWSPGSGWTPTWTSLSRPASPGASSDHIWRMPYG